MRAEGGAGGRDEEVIAEVPEGFRPLNRGGPFFETVGPVFARRDTVGGVVLGLRVREAHTNMLGITHGGMLVTVADGALGINLSMRREAPMVTVNLSTDFLGSARPGDWLEAHVHVKKQGRRLSFAACELRVGDAVLLTCSGVFATLGGPTDMADRSAPIPG